MGLGLAGQSGPRVEPEGNVVVVGIIEDRLTLRLPSGLTRGPLAASTRPMAAWVYIMANRPLGTIYVGSTTNLVQRVWQHRNEVVPSFTREYRCHLLVYFEGHQDIRHAMQRERNVKHWVRDWKVELIEKSNPEWDDLYGLIVGG